MERRFRFKRLTEVRGDPRNQEKGISERKRRSKVVNPVSSVQQFLITRG